MAPGKRENADLGGPQPESAPGPKRFCFRLWDGVVPEAVSVGLCVLVLAGIVGVALLGDQLLRSGLESSRMAAGRALAQAAASAIRSMTAEENSDATALNALLAAGVQAVRWQGPGAEVREWVLNSDGSLFRERGDATALVAAPTISRGQQFVATLADASDAQGGSVTVTLARFTTWRPRLWLAGGAAAAAFLALLGYLAIYERLRRHVQPLAAIQRNLESYADGIERDLMALSLSDSFGAVAASWNRLIEQTNSVREQATVHNDGDLTQSAMKRFENRTLRDVLDRLPIGVIRCRTDERIVYANSSACRLLSTSQSKIRDQYLPPVVGEEVSTPLLGAYQRGATSEVIDRQSGEGDKESTLRFRLVPSLTVGDEAELLITVEDVTHVREAERARDNFLYHVTHELRTPLTNIHAYAETLGRPGFDDESTRKECYNVIISESKRLSTLVEDILSVSQLEVGSLRLELADVDILKLMRAMVQDNLGRADAKRIDLRLKLPPKAPAVRGDKQRLAILISNLIGNAIKYTPSGGQVDVHLEAQDDSLRITVADTGIGIAESDQKHVFDKFYRVASEAVQQTSGTGLGLAIAREIARLHGGDIELQSALGRGSTLIVELPASPQGASVGASS